MNKDKLVILFYLIFLCSCLYKAGNRQPDINYRLDINISPYYVKEYMETIDPFYTDSYLTTSEINNFPDCFIPVKDSILGYKYVIEFYNFDSSRSIINHYINLASIYDYKKGKWVKDRDELTNNELEKFRIFFKNNVLTKVVDRYKNKIPDSLLFVNQSRVIEIKPLK